MPAAGGGEGDERGSGGGGGRPPTMGDRRVVGGNAAGSGEEAPAAVETTSPPRGAAHPLLQRLAAERRQRQQQQQQQQRGGDDVGSPLPPVPPAPAAVAPLPSSAAAIEPSASPRPTSTLNQRSTSAASIGAAAGGSGSSGSRTPTQRPSGSDASLGASAAVVGAVGAGAAPTAGAGRAGDGMLTISVRVPGLQVPIPVHVAMTVDDGHRDSLPPPSPAAAAAASSGASFASNAAGGGATGAAASSGPPSSGPSAQGSGPAAAGDTHMQRPATGADLADAFVPVLQTTILQAPDFFRTGGVGDAASSSSASTLSRYTYDTGAFDPARWQFAHRAEFIRPATQLAGKLRAGDTGHAIFTALPQAEQNRRREAMQRQQQRAAAEEAAERAPPRAPDAATAAAAEAAAPGANVGGDGGEQRGEDPAVRADMEALLAGFTGGRTRMTDLTGEQRDLLRVVARLVQHNADLDGDEQDGRRNQRRARPATAAAAAATGATAAAAAAAEDTAGAQVCRWTAKVRKTEESWDERMIGVHVSETWRHATPAGTAVMGGTAVDMQDGGATAEAEPTPAAAAAAADADPLRDPNAGRRVLRLNDADDNDAARGGGGGLARAGRISMIPGVTRATAVEFDVALQRYVLSFSGPDALFMVLFAVGVLCGPLCALAMQFFLGAPPKLWVALAAGAFVNFILLASGAVDHQVTTAIGPNMKPLPVS